MVLVPNAVKVVAKTGDDPFWEGEVCVPTPTSGKFACLSGMRFVLSPLFSKDIPCLAWAVKTTHDQKSANMAWSTIKVTDVGVAEGPREHTKTVRVSTKTPAVAPTAKASAVAPPDAPASLASPSSSTVLAREFSMEVPVMINARALNNSDELVLHRPKPSDIKEAKPTKLANILKAKGDDKAAKPSSKSANIMKAKGV